MLIVFIFLPFYIQHTSGRLCVLYIEKQQFSKMN